MLKWLKNLFSFAATKEEKYVLDDPCICCDENKLCSKCFAVPCFCSPICQYEKYYGKCLTDPCLCFKENKTAKDKIVIALKDCIADWRAQASAEEDSQRKPGGNSDGARSYRYCADDLEYTLEEIIKMLDNKNE
jgi:hypothetical protein